MRKIFVVSEYVCHSQNSTGYFWSKVIKKLSSEGREASVITVDSDTLHEDSSRYAGVDYIVFKGQHSEKKGFLGKLLIQISLVFGFYKMVRSNVKPTDLVFSGTNPALLLIVMPLLKRLYKFKWCLLVHDVFPQNLVPAGLLSRNSLIYRLLSGLFDRVYSSPDHLFVIGRDMKILIEDKISTSDKVTVIQNWVDDGDIEVIPKRESELINRLGWQDKIVFQFFGNIGRLQGASQIIQAIEQVKSSRAAFLFIGNGTAVCEIEDFIARSDVGNVAYAGALPQEQKSQGLAACDVAIVSLEKGMTGLGVPSKAYFSMAADKPLLTIMEPEAEVAQMVNDEQIGWNCCSDDPVRIAQVIDEICEAGAANTECSPRAVLKGGYSESVLLDRMMTQLTLLLR
jgi:glycosyltransferase involved in cell wall biosynthesis